MRIKPTTKNSLLVKIDVYPDCPVQCPECPDIMIRSIRTVTRSLRVTVSSKVSLGPKSLDPYVRSIRTYTRNIRVPFTQQLVFCERGYKYPPYPFIYLSLAHLKQNKPASKRRALPLPFFHSWVIFLGDSSEIVAREKIRASKLPFHLLSTTSLAGGFKFITLEASNF
jgi:hypothetical protein